MKHNLGLRNCLFAFCLIAAPAVAEITANKPVIKEVIGLDGIQWRTETAYKAANLVIVGPEDFRLEQEFGPDDTLFLDFAALAKAASPNGRFKYELRFSPLVNEAEKALALEARALGQKVDFLVKDHFSTVVGGFSLANGNIVDGDLPEHTLKDFVINDDLIVDGSTCVGFDCVNGEVFGFDTLRLKENNLRIKFDDTSVAASFPRNDWQLTANESANGGASKFSIEDISGGRTPFTVEANARSHSLYVDDGGRIGSRTSTPSVEIHTIDGDTPTLRLQQDGSSGFEPQTWDVAGNETNFFIRDVTNGSQLPFRIRPDAPTSSIFIDTDGDVGLGTSSPTNKLDVRGRADIAPTAGTVALKLGGAAGIAFQIDAGNEGTDFWQITSTGGDAILRFNRTGGGNEMELSSAGDMTITGDYFSATCTSPGSPCAPDYVFAADYGLMPLEELSQFISANQHLPNVPSEDDLRQARKINMSTFQMTLLEKIEELTLYTLQQQQTITNLTSRLEALEID